jgi:hypothetical protein
MTTLEDFTKNLLLLMEETFESKHHGICLDKGASLFETLDTVSAAKASIPVGGARSIVAHTEYHFGEIRQALCTLK